MPFPWMKIGLANLVTLLVLVLWDIKHAFIVVIIRILIGNLILGKLFTPSFILSLGGGIGAVFGMYFLWKYFRNNFSLIGISIFGAFIHNLVQLTLASITIVHQWSLFYLMPMLAISAIITGTLIGVLAQLLTRQARILQKFI